MDALVAERRRKMAISAHAFVRGSTVQFYEWLAAHHLPLPDGPPVWICGDCHVGNLGPVASGDGAVAIQVRDLDQTVIGNPAHDVLRLALSLAMAARGSDLPGVTTARMLERVVVGYDSAFAPGAQGEVFDTEAFMPRVVRQVMRSAAQRSWRHLADERIEGDAPRIPLGKRFWPLTDNERQAVEVLMAEEDMKHLVTSLRGRKADAAVRVLDAAFWRKGCSSLGRLRVAVLVAIGTGHAERHCLMDVKEATASVAPCSAGASMPRDDADRVVAGARSLSPFLGARMSSSHMLGRSVFLRELLPQDLKFEIEHLTAEEAMNVAEFLAHVVGRGHARQMDESSRQAWRTELAKGQSRAFGAPFWLWDSVVDAVGTHESPYLQHCREWALADAA